MATPTASTAGATHPGQDEDAERLDRRDLLLLRLELKRRRRPVPPGSSAQRETRSTR